MADNSPDTPDADLTMIIDPDLTIVMEPDSTDDQDPDPQAEDTTWKGVEGPEPIPEYALVIVKGQQKGREWILSPGVTWVGRHPYNDIALDHITVSRRHCRLGLDATGLSIKDLGSTNGCYVNDRLVDKATLKAGDRIMIGTFHLMAARRSRRS